MVLIGSTSPSDELESPTLAVDLSEFMPKFTIEPQDPVRPISYTQAILQSLCTVEDLIEHLQLSDETANDPWFDLATDEPSLQPRSNIQPECAKGTLQHDNLIAEGQRAYI